MSTLSPPRLFDLPLTPEREREHTNFDRSEHVRSSSSDGGRLTLEQRLDRVWEGLSAAGAASCPVCHGRLERTASGRGRCRSCGSTLS
jgi:ribosomal protein L37AE/L43A